MLLQLSHSAMPTHNIQQEQDILQEFLSQPSHRLHLLGSGMCNDAWLFTTASARAYLVKCAKAEPEETEQNNLLTEARLF